MLPEKPSVAIIGDGVVGGALRAWFTAQQIDAPAYDPLKGLTDRSVLAHADVIFVCVPTPYTPGRGFDDRFLLDAVRGVPDAKCVVIKSTVLPGTTDLLQGRYPNHRFLFNPEFLREATALEDMMSPDREIVGHTDKSRDDAPAVLHILPPAPFNRICHAAEAEMAKYVANCFLAAKVSYFNEVFDLCERLRIDYEGVRDIVAADARIGASHSDVFDGGYRGYGGKCLPKDSRALLDLARSLGMELQVLRAAADVNSAFHEDLPAVERRDLDLRFVPAALSADERAA